MKPFIFIPFLFVLFSCGSADHVTKPTKPKYAPKGYAAKGVVKYLNQGADFVIKNRRENAFKKMYDSCGGEYKILSEGSKREGGMVTQGFGNSLLVMDSDYWYISYQCLK